MEGVRNTKTTPPEAPGAIAVAIIVVATAVVATVAFVIVTGSCGFASAGEPSPDVCGMSGGLQLGLAAAAPILVLLSTLAARRFGKPWLMTLTSVSVFALLLAWIAAAN